MVKWPSMGLRGKFLVALVIVSMLPLAVGLVVLQTAGFRHLLATQGDKHRAEARTLARSLDHAVESQAGHLRSWLAADASVEHAAAGANHGDDTAGGRPAAIQAIEEAWPGLPEDDPLIAGILRNPAAESLRGYLALHPPVAEILVTDAAGRVVAATRKTSDYDQSDEGWWRVGMNLARDCIWTDVLHFDASAKVFSLDLVMPLHGPDGVIGVVKTVIDVSPLFQRIAGRSGGGERARLEIVLPDGRVIARPGESGAASARPEFDAETMLCIRVGREGWTAAKDARGEKRMIGFAAIQAPEIDRRRFEPGGYVLFSTSHDTVVAPLRRQVVHVGLWAGAAVALCSLAGYGYLRNKVLQPLAALGYAARSVAATVRLRHVAGQNDDEAAALRREAEADLERIQAIRTGDEVEDLAGDFAVMTSRVLRYHRELEAEVNAKTAVIREDLELAREFQNALMPAGYPEVPPAKARDPLRLGFAHFYQPASTVGGDFFDLVELDEHRVGVLIADVMGHGARSALVTAILRALVRNHAAEAEDPGAFLGLLNRHLYEMIERSGQTLFVTAFFMVLDTREARATWAVAGHPAPLRARRATGNPPQLLWTGALHQPALGLLPDAVYRTSSSPLRAGDVFLLFTDGVVEAENVQGHEFGVKRLISSFDEALDGPLAAVPAKIVCEVSAFQKRQRQEDDVCVVAVEVGHGVRPDFPADAALAGSAARAD